MDDILIFSTRKTHKQDIEDLLDVLIQYGLRISPHKCQMFRDQLVYISLHFLIKDGKPCLKPMKDKCDAIRSMLPLRSVKECRQFCRMVNFLSTFLPKLREYLIPIYALTKKKAVFKWSDECQKAFDKIKQCLHKPPVLRMPNRSGYFRLESDTSREAAGGALYQLQDNQWVFIGYHSKRLPEAVHNYGICELELTGFVCNIHGFEHLLKNSYFEVIIDHKAIEYLKRAKYEPTTGRLSALLLKLQNYAFDIKYLEGSKLKVSDALSRLYAEEKHSINDVIPLTFLWHTADFMLHLDQLQQAHQLYAHKAVDTQIRTRRNRNKTKKKPSPKSTPIEIKDTSDANNSQLVPKRPPKVTKKVPQEQHIVPVMTETRQTIVTNKLVNPDLKTLFDVECNKELQVNIRDPDLKLFKSETPLIKPQDKITIYQCHIPPQFEIDRVLSELRSKVLRQRTINIETADLITEYDKNLYVSRTFTIIFCMINYLEMQTPRKR